jgi:hypothetical protein
LGGFIDGEGSFGLNQNKQPYCEITVHKNEVQVLAKIKQKLGGTVARQRLGGNDISAYRWRLHSASGMRKLVALVNGNINQPDRFSQFSAICAALNIPPVSKPITRASS